MLPFVAFCLVMIFVLCIAVVMLENRIDRLEARLKQQGAIVPRKIHQDEQLRQYRNSA